MYAVGYRLALLADQQTTISPRAKIVLSRMAWHAMDDPKGEYDAAVYFHGWELLTALFPNASPIAAKQNVARAIRELTDAGIVKPLDVETARGRNQRYELMV